MTDLVALLVLLVLSAVFSGSETALVSLSIGRAEGLLKEGRRGAAALYQLKRDPVRMLTTILIGNNLVNIAASVMATVIATRWFGAAGPGIAVGVLTMFILVFGEITPKTIATRYSERLSLLIAPPMLGFMRLMFPLVWILVRISAYLHRFTGERDDPTVTQSELIHMLGHGEKEGTIAHGERELIERVFAFNNLRVRDVMTPESQIFALDGSRTVAEAMPVALRGSVSRIPLYRGQRDNLYKVVHLRDLLEAAATGNLQARLDAIAHEPLFVPQSQSIEELFASLRAKKLHFAIVVDEYGVIRGVVTLEDLLEELVGEIYDETDIAPVVVNRVSDDEIVVDGAAELRVVEEFFGLDLPGKPTDSVSLWIIGNTQSIPQQGESFSIDGLAVRIVKASPRRIYRVSISREARVEAAITG
ncbi:MAG: hemolysin family protein [Gammaproteobacteria bacterium]|jgi:CBS domain containing-hemolysin-like protein